MGANAVLTHPGSGRTMEIQLLTLGRLASCYGAETKLSGVNERGANQFRAELRRMGLQVWPL